MQQQQQQTDPLPGPRGAHAAPTGLLGFLHAYPNPLARFTTGASSVSVTSITAAATTLMSKSSSTSLKDKTASNSPVSTPRKLPGGLGDIGSNTSGHAPGMGGTLYPMSTLVVVALIAFLIGSLLRSLLSPADFIYVVTDLGEAEEAKSVAGWREIRRLVEMKYIFGGWDFQIAVVRRH